MLVTPGSERVNHGVSDFSRKLGSVLTVFKHILKLKSDVFLSVTQAYSD